MDCDRDRDRPRLDSGDAAMRRDKGRSVSECQEDRAKSASCARFPRAWYAGGILYGIPGFNGPQKSAIMRSKPGGHLGNFGLTLLAMARVPVRIQVFEFRRPLLRGNRDSR